MAERQELHGIRRQPFPGFDEDRTYLERVTIPEHAEAVALLQDYGADWGAEPRLKVIWMRYIEGTEAEGMIERDEVYCDFPKFWWECPEDHPAAVPFWKDAP